MKVRFLGISCWNGWGCFEVVEFFECWMFNEYVCKVLDKMIVVKKNFYIGVFYFDELIDVYVRELILKFGKM